MKLEKQVCTLEQAKILKELGVEQTSVFYYTQEKTPSNPNMILYGYKQEDIPIQLLHGKQSSYSTSNVFVEYSAFTVGELGNLIGKGTKASEKHWQWLLDCVNSGLSGTVCYNPVALAGFIISQIHAFVIQPTKINLPV